MKVPDDAINLTAFFTWLGDDGIVRSKVKANMDVNAMHAIENSKAVNALSENGAKFPLIVDIRDLKSISHEARKVFSMQNRESNVTSFALIIKSPVSKIIGNFFISINKPAVKTKLTNSEREAKEWLQSLEINRFEKVI